MKQTILIQGQANVDVYYIAACGDCTPVLPIPFWDSSERNEWTAIHIASTGHKVACATEIKIDA